MIASNKFQDFMNLESQWQEILATDLHGQYMK
jgi:hypothetical protein